MHGSNQGFASNSRDHAQDAPSLNPDFYGSLCVFVHDTIIQYLQDVVKTDRLTISPWLARWVARWRSSVELCIPQVAQDVIRRDGRGEPACGS